MSWALQLVLLSLSTLLVSVHGDDFCMKANPPLVLPRCTDDCLKEEHYDGTCAENLRGFCSLSEGIRSYFGIYSDCLLDKCQDEDDRIEFIGLFEEQCSSAKHPITTIEGQLGEYLGLKTASRAAMSTKAPEEPKTTIAEPMSADGPTSTSVSNSSSSSQPRSTPTSTDEPSSVTSEPSEPSELSSATSEPSPSTSPERPPSPITQTPTSSLSSPTSTATASSTPYPEAPPLRPGIVAAIASGGAVGLLSIVIASIYVWRRKPTDDVPFVDRFAHIEPLDSGASNSGMMSENSVEMRGNTRSELDGAVYGRSIGGGVAELGGSNESGRSHGVGNGKGRFSVGGRGRGGWNIGQNF